MQGGPILLWVWLSRGGGRRVGRGPTTVVSGVPLLCPRRWEDIGGRAGGREEVVQQDAPRHTDVEGVHCCPQAPSPFSTPPSIQRIQNQQIFILLYTLIFFSVAAK